ncbi:MAG TPA: ATP-dependent sacrificial sulfur transferase LarE, partial [bacterium]
AVTADSPSVPRREIDEAQRIAQSFGARHKIIQTDELQDANYAKNPANRCYFCKTELYSKLSELAKAEGVRFVANGTNVDDLGDYRPGLLAASEYQVISPLQEAGFTKNDVRQLARLLQLEIWDKPASPCLSSRIPYGSAVTPAKLAMIEAAEDCLRSFNIRELRVRHFGDTARIEANPADLHVIRQNLELISGRFKQIGFAEIDLAEFRSGALNASLISIR